MTAEVEVRQDNLMPGKIRREHRERLAVVYIRQSTVQQVVRHQESTRLQYALVDRAAGFGWAHETIVVIDDDLGRSGATTEGRVGFQRLVAEVGLGHVGLVLGVEMSRLARSCRDWHQLLEICALFDTLIADVEGVYDPANYNDRLLLGLKGTMSEAELHILKARMLAGRRAKAARGELGKAVPMGYVRRGSGEIVFDPDEQARATIRMVFAVFERQRTIGRLMRYLVEHDVRMPVRVATGPAKGELEWRRVNRQTLRNLLSNPIYAGAYVYGARSVDRRRQKPGRRSTGRRTVPVENAEVFLRDRLPAYISWEQYLRNRAQMQANTAAHGSPVRAGQALLSGVLVCGRCGLRMNSQYNNNGRDGRYACRYMNASYNEPICQSLKAAPLDELVAGLVLRALAPGALEASLALAEDLDAERAVLDRQWQQRRERARYEVDRARRQYDAVEPENRLVARTLERAWEAALAEQGRLDAEYERAQRDRMAAPTAAELAAIRDLAEDLPTLWHAETTIAEERKTIIRLLLDRVLVTVIDRSEQVRIECHWQGGHRTSHALIRPVARLEMLSTYADLLARATELYRFGRGFSDIAATLNQEGWRPAKRRDTFTASMVNKFLQRAGVIQPSHRARRPIDRRPDEWTVCELAKRVAMPESTLYNWVRRGRLRCRQVLIGGTVAKLVHADAQTIASLQAIRSTPEPWRRLPPPTTAASQPPIST